MKEVTVDGHNFQYETFIEHSEWGIHAETVFYQGVETTRRRKWLIFGPEVAEEKPKAVFSIYADTEDPTISKRWWSEEIRKKIELLDRKSEIERGELC